MGADYFKAFDDIFDKIHLLYKKTLPLSPIMKLTVGLRN